MTLPPTTVGAVVQLLVWFILGFALYSTAMGFLGSLASRMEEASNASMPVTMTATACYLASILLVTQDPDGVLAMAMTFFPPAAPMVVPLRAALGAIEPWEIGAVHRPDAGRDLGHVRRGSPRLRGCHPPDRQPDPDPRRLARPQLNRGRQPAWTSAQRKHAVSWSFTRPADCISA